MYTISSFDETPFLNSDYWSLLKDILEIKKDSLKCHENNNNIDSLIRDQDELSKLLNKLPLINVFTKVSEFFIDFSNDEIDNDKLKLLELINQNFQKLIKIFKSSIDQITTLALNACNLLVKSIFNVSSSSNDDDDDDSMNIDHLMDIDIEQKKSYETLLVEFFLKVVKFLNYYFIINSNQKKVFCFFYYFLFYFILFFF